ncbi:hypothetical protein HanRHA438_Chr07g0319891 [Helianthus annuus]|nr:hypothetical protein HanHA89_Chr07g0273021 [Helianthus annuus]KAJ0732395.1 hypothetical protein HanOQP8_Chr07g0262711 [Helianthus annuus]KAJ0909285.1 hypothetical protein HanRHA438_Chr07g0319891 [Helianthus annuus]
MEKKDNAMKLLRLIWGYIAKKPKKEIDDILRGPRDVVMQDDKEPVSLEKRSNLIRLYPDLIWKVDDNNQSIFHVAVAHRHEGIYNLLYDIGSMKDLISPLRDRNDNNMLHLVGKCAKQKQLKDVSGVALKVQRELLWFKVYISLDLGVFKTIRIRKSDLKYPISESEISEKSDIRISRIRIQIVIFKIFGYFGYPKI